MQLSFKYQFTEIHPLKAKIVDANVHPIGLITQFPGIVMFAEKRLKVKIFDVNFTGCRRQANLSERDFVHAVLRGQAVGPQFDADVVGIE